jgi:hypothetical protein
MFDRIGYWTMENKLTSIALNIILVGMIGLIGLIAYWGFRPYNILEYETCDLQTVKESYEVGEVLDFRLQFCKKGNYTATIIRSFHDGVVYMFPALTSKLDEGCYDYYANTTVVPNVQSGTYTYKTQWEYRVNPIRTVTYEFTSNEFRVVNNN